MQKSLGVTMLLIAGGLLLVGCFRSSQDPAVAMSIEPSSGYSPLRVHLQAHAVESEAFSYVWEFGDGITVEGSEMDHTFTGVGTVPVRLIITDVQGRQTTLDSAIYLLNRAPSARFTFHPNPAPTHHPIAFDARESYDSDGEIASYHWSFGDGSEAAEAVVEHVYESPGNGYRVILTVTDAAGESNTMYRDLELIGCDH